MLDGMSLCIGRLRSLHPPLRLAIGNPAFLLDPRQEVAAGKPCFHLEKLPAQFYHLSVRQPRAAQWRLRRLPSSGSGWNESERICEAIGGIA